MGQPRFAGIICAPHPLSGGLAGQVHWRKALRALALVMRQGVEFAPLPASVHAAGTARLRWPRFLHTRKGGMIGARDKAEGLGRPRRRETCLLVRESPDRRSACPVLAPPMQRASANYARSEVPSIPGSRGGPVPHEPGSKRTARPTTPTAPIILNDNEL